MDTVKLTPMQHKLLKSHFKAGYLTYNDVYAIYGTQHSVSQCLKRLIALWLIEPIGFQKYRIRREEIIYEELFGEEYD